MLRKNMLFCSAMMFRSSSTQKKNYDQPFNNVLGQTLCTQANYVLLRIKLCIFQPLLNLDIAEHIFEVAIGRTD